MKPGNRSIRQRTTRLNERILYLLRSYRLYLQRTDVLVPIPSEIHRVSGR
jgi:hypothetical protein